MNISRKATAALLAASLAGGAGVGAIMTTPMVAFAADASTESTAEATARTPGQWITDALKGLVDKGTITQEQSDAVAKALEDARPEGPRGGFLMHHSPASEAAAEVLGISEDDLRAALETKSLADVAKDKNIDVQKVIDALVAEKTAHLDEAVANGKLTQERADELKADLTERTTDMVNDVLPHRSLRAGHGTGHGMMRHAPAPADDTTATGTVAS